MQKRMVKRGSDRSGKPRTEGRPRGGAASEKSAAVSLKAERPAPEVRKSETVSIQGYSSDGRGIGRVEDGRVIFVPGVIRGESVCVRFSDRGDRFLNGVVDTIPAPSEDRLPLRYPGLMALGLGDLQFLPPERQRLVKTEILRDQLARVGKLALTGDEIRPMIASPAEWGYLAEAGAALGADGRLIFAETLDGESGIPLADRAINEVLGEIHFAPDSGLSAVTGRVDRNGEVQLILTGASEAPEIELETDLPLSIVYTGGKGSYVLSGDSTIVQDVGGIAIAVGDRSPCFLNPRIYAPVFEALAHECSWMDGGSVLTIQPGSGLWTKWAALRGARCSAIMESEAEADEFVLNLEDAATADCDVELYLGYPDEVLGRFSSVPDCAILDLTSGGLHVRTVDALARSGVKRLMAVGSEAGMTARDVGRLARAGFRPWAILPFDTCPQTASFGTVVLMERD